MRVSALRITKPQAPPPPPDLWEEFEDLRDVTLRHGHLWHDTADVMDAGLRNRRYLFETYRPAPEDWLEQQRAKNRALALAQYEWRKPENVAARVAKAEAAYVAQKAREAAQANALREQLVASEAARILREDEEREAEKAWLKAQKVARAEQVEAEAAAAIAWWASINPWYRHEIFRPCKFDRPMQFGRVTLKANQGYLLPESVRAALLEQLGY